MLLPRYIFFSRLGKSATRTAGKGTSMLYDHTLGPSEEATALQSIRSM
jgi:hypothetical protein